MDSDTYRNEGPTSWCGCLAGSSGCDCDEHAEDAAKESALSQYGQGWRDAVDAAQLCGAYNDRRPPPQYALCIKRNDHTGKHDDMWLPWGDRLADVAGNRLDARGHRAWVKDRSGGAYR